MVLVIFLYLPPFSVRNFLPLPTAATPAFLFLNTLGSNVGDALNRGDCLYVSSSGAAAFGDGIRMAYGAGERNDIRAGDGIRGEGAIPASIANGFGDGDLGFAAAAFAIRLAIAAFDIIGVAVTVLGAAA